MQSGRVSATLLTPRGKGAVASVLVTGPQAQQILDQFFHPRRPSRWRAQQPGQFFYGQWLGPEHYQEDLIICALEADRYEIHCHGGELPACEILRHLASHGVEEVTPWARLVAESEDLLVAEARWLLAQVKAREPAALLARQLSGSLRRSVEALTSSCRAHQSRESLEHIECLLASWAWGRRVTRPFRIVLYGPPNAGKSSLINSLLGYDRAIVFDAPGTTRDVVATRSVIAGWPVELTDTAGIRLAPVDHLEQEGIRRADLALSDADLLILVKETPEQSWLGVPREFSGDIVKLLHKADLCAKSETEPHAIATSVVDNTGIPELIERIAAAIVPEAPAPEAVVFTHRQFDLLSDAQHQLARQDFDTAINRLAALSDPTRSALKPPAPVP